jgi:hypothetical protein
MWIWSKKLAKEKAMVKIKRFPNSIEQSEAASKAVEYLIDARFADFERGRGIKTLRGKERGDPQKS